MSGCCMKLFVFVLSVIFMVAHIFAQNITTLVPPPKTAYSYGELPPFSLSSQTQLILPDSVSPEILRAADYLQREILLRAGISIERKSLAAYINSVPPVQFPAIVLVPSDNAFYTVFRKKTLNSIETVPSVQGGYIADIRSREAVIMFNDYDGAFNAVATVLQLLDKNAKILPACHVWDAPDYPIRWMFSQHNLLSDNNISKLAAIVDTMIKYKMNGIQQSDYKYNIIDRMTAKYFANVDSLKRLCTARNLDIIPSVCNIGWSDGILQHNVNLAEGVEARSEYIVSGDTARLITDANVSLPEGGFENVNAQGKFPGWGFYDDCFKQDKTTFHTGKASAHATDVRTSNAAGNARFSQTVNCAPHGYYVMSAWIKTLNLQGGSFQLLAIGKDAKGASHTLTFTALDIPPTTNGWLRIETSFNTLESASVSLYCGVWGVNGGEFWIDDFEIRPAGLTNILRRSGAPLSIYKKATGFRYLENIDFAPVFDTIAAKSNGTFGPYHTPPALRCLPGGWLRNGDTILVSYFHPFTAVSNNQGNGSVMVCPSEDTLYNILGDQISRVNNLYKPENFFLSHDEIRNLNRDSSCLRRKISPAAILADNVRKCDSIIASVASSSRRFVWSDMFDSLHNAVNNYYLINGDLTGIWLDIPKTLTIVNWNGGKKEKSMNFFARQGFRQITSPYYDAGTSAAIRSWRLAQEGIENIDGMMYTTWEADYSQLRAFGYYAWGAGPYIMHRPLDSAALGKSSASLIANIASDPFDAADSIISAAMIIHEASDLRPRRIAMQRGTQQNLWTAAADLSNEDWIRYSIEATNKQGLTRQTPHYEIRRESASAAEEAFEPILLNIWPNPTLGTANCAFTAVGAWSINLTDAIGKTTVAATGYAYFPQTLHIPISTATLPSGAYRLTVTIKDRIEGTTLIKR